MKISLRDKLIFPAGCGPGFDAAHPAAQGCVHSVIATGAANGALLNLLTPSASVSGIANAVGALNGVIGPMQGLYNYAGMGFANAALPSLVHKFTGAFITYGPAASTGTGQLVIGNNSVIQIFGYNGQVRFYLNGAYYGTASGINGAGALPILDTPLFIAFSYDDSIGDFNCVVVDLATGQQYSGVTAGGPAITLAQTGNTINWGGSGNASAANSSYLAAAMFSVGNVLSLNQLLEWADDAWSFWYPSPLSEVLNVVGVAAGSGATVSIAGATATASAGSATPQDSLVIGAVVATAAAGSVVPEAEPALGGVALVAAAGSVAPELEPPIAGSSAVAAAGSVAPEIFAGVTGAAATGAAGVVSAGGALFVAIAGAAAAAGAGVLSAALDAAIAGAAANALAGGLVAADGASLSGAAAVSDAGALIAGLAGLPAGAAAIAAAGSLAPAVTVAPPGAAIAALAGLVVPQRPGDVFGVFAQAIAGVVTVTAVADFFDSPRFVIVPAEFRRAFVAGEYRRVFAAAQSRSAPLS